MLLPTDRSKRKLSAKKSPEKTRILIGYFLDSQLNAVNKRFYNFGAYRLDTHNHRLLRDGETVALTPKEFEVLLTLVENAGDVVGKDALLEAVWKDVYVNEETLMRNVSWLRKKLSYNGNESFIETVPKRGYRFTAPVTMSDVPETIIEEQTLTRIRIEETVSTDGSVQIENNSDLKIINVEDSQPQAQKLLLPSTTRKPQRVWLALGVLAMAAVIAVVVYQTYIHRGKPKLSLVMNVKPFSGSVGRENTPAFSPDGKQLVFSWNGGEGDTGDIYLQLLGAGDPIRLTTNEFNEHYPTFSPDGSHIAFVRDLKTHGEVVLIPALGGAERRVCRLFSGFGSISFAPDGQTIAVVDTADSAPGKPHAIHLVQLKTGERRRLTAPAEFIGETTPRFAPDGKSLAFVRVSAGNTHDLFAVPTNGDNGNEPRQITFDRAVIHSLAWSADGRQLFFVSFRQSSRSNIWRVAASGGEPELVATGGRDITNLAVSPNGKTFAFVENTLHSDIRRLLARESANGFITSTYSEDFPHLLPAASRVVFRSNRSGKNEAWLADANGKNLRQLTDSRYLVGTPRFSPDGTRIVYEGRADSNSDIFVVAIEGGGTPQRLTMDAGSNLLPDWSADGKWIYFNSNRTGEDQIWRMPADGSGEAVQITRQGAIKAAPAPDGKWIYYSKEFNSFGLWRVSTTLSAATSDEMPVPELAEAGYRHSWTIMGNGILFIARADQPPYKIKFFDFATRQIRELATTDRAAILDCLGLSASADGKTILYAQYDHNTSNIMLAELGN